MNNINKSNTIKLNEDKNKKKTDLISNEIEKKIYSIKKKKKNMRLRFYAEIENIKKNNSKEVLNIQNNMFFNFIQSIVPIVNKIDNLVKKSENFIVEKHPVIEGIKLTKNIFEKNLKIWNIKKINKLNIPFNSNIHSLKKTQKLKKITNTTIIKNIIKNGYTFNKKVIKKAIVQI
ncbi:nucleotide exchange factor GrpE [Buchnera aphidicola]|uniref:Protein GrpE n=1 Tax=Buchnera aphidicola (Cinara strobi) TaxID=1921549 RepID=A0A3B1DVW2_9GAMM|nr:nucleotide exchange factor GrpE [Buchnera aphidicola]VAX76413.1 Protein GrpE [Buchnera aphidicola (Cinara strobi)]